MTAKAGNKTRASGVSKHSANYAPTVAQPFQEAHKQGEENITQTFEIFYTKTDLEM